jgi:hypothetical protein
MDRRVTMRDVADRILADLAGEDGHDGKDPD